MHNRLKFIPQGHMTYIMPGIPTILASVLKTLTFLFIGHLLLRWLRINAVRVEVVGGYPVVTIFERLIRLRALIKKLLHSPTHRAIVHTLCHSPCHRNRSYTHATSRLQIDSLLPSSPPSPPSTVCTTVDQACSFALFYVKRKRKLVKFCHRNCWCGQHNK